MYNKNSPKAVSVPCNPNNHLTTNPVPKKGSIAPKSLFTEQPLHLRRNSTSNGNSNDTVTVTVLVRVRRNSEVLILGPSFLENPGELTDLVDPMVRDNPCLHIKSLHYHTIVM